MKLQTGFGEIFGQDFDLTTRKELMVDIPTAHWMDLRGYFRRLNEIDIGAYSDRCFLYMDASDVSQLRDSCVDDYCDPPEGLGVFLNRLLGVIEAGNFNSVSFFNNTELKGNGRNVFIVPNE